MPLEAELRAIRWKLFGNFGLYANGVPAAQNEGGMSCALAKAVAQSTIV